MASFYTCHLYYHSKHLDCGTLRQSCVFQDFCIYQSSPKEGLMLYFLLCNYKSYGNSISIARPKSVRRMYLYIIVVLTCHLKVLGLYLKSLAENVPRFHWHHSIESHELWSAMSISEIILVPNSFVLLFLTLELPLWEFHVCSCAVQTKQDLWLFKEATLTPQSTHPFQIQK